MKPATPPQWLGHHDNAAKPLWEALGLKTGAEDPETTEAQRNGYAVGLRNAKVAVEEIMERYHQTIVELEFLRDRILVDAERELVALALEIAHQALLSDPTALQEFTVRMVREALHQLRDADQITLHVSPTDAVALAEKHPELMGDKAVVKVVEDPKLTLGGVVAECEFGRVNASLSQRLQDIGARLRAVPIEEPTPPVTTSAAKEPTP